MTKSQNTKNEQQKDLCITSEQLTEQMHKGKLPEGWYYVIKTGDVEMLEYSCNCFLDGDVPLMDNEVTEVLAPVPTFDEWEQLQNWADFTNNYHELREKLEIAEYENAQFKELLKECKPYIALYTESNKHIGFTPEIANLLQRINEVLQ